jgi:hypothetical protein
MKNTGLSGFLFFALLICFNTVYSQNWQWAIGCAKGIENDYGTITSDAEGNVYLTGDYTAPQGIFGNDTLQTLGTTPYMFCKIDNNGNFVWVKGITTLNQLSASNLKCFTASNDSYDGVYFCGIFAGDVLFDTVHIQAYNDQIFLANFTLGGSCRWVREFGSHNSNNDNPWCLDIDKNGNAVVCGYLPDTAMLGPFTIPRGVFIAKINPQGDFIFAKKIADYSMLDGIYIKNVKWLNQGDFILYGRLEANDSAYLENVLLTGHGNDMILAKYSSYGELKWVKIYGDGVVPTSASNDSSDALYLAGLQLTYELHIGSITLTQPSMIYLQTYFVKIDSSGSPIWGFNTQSQKQVLVQKIISDKEGYCYFTGRIEAPVQIGSCTIYPVSSRDMFLARINSSGDCIGAVNTGTADGLSVAMDASGNPIVAGQFEQTVNFGNYPVTSMGAKDIFIAKCDAITAIPESKQSISNGLVIYANPTTGKCNITIPDEFMNEKNLTLRIYDSKGKLIQSAPIEISDGRISLNISAQAEGIYQAMLSDGKRVYSGKIIFSK